MLNPDRLDTAIPVPALVLGVAGLIPFVALPLGAWLRVVAPAADHVTALIAYAAVILSFMGGVQWGLAMRAAPSVPGPAALHYAISVLPALLAWSAFSLDPRTGLVLLATGFVALLAYDLWTIRRGLGPAWYAPLRLGLTAVVVLSLCVTAAVFG